MQLEDITMPVYVFIYFIKNIHFDGENENAIFVWARKAQTRNNNNETTPTKQAKYLITNLSNWSTSNNIIRNTEIAE